MGIQDRFRELYGYIERARNSKQLRTIKRWGNNLKKNSNTTAARNEYRKLITAIKQKSKRLNIRKN